MRLVLSFRWHRDYHGRCRPDDPAIEWPPSPWRLFCALVSAARPRSVAAIPDCLRWLAAQPAPIIHAPPAAAEGVPEPKHSVPLDGIELNDPFRESDHARQHLFKFRQDTRLELRGSKTIAFVWSAADGIPDGIAGSLDELMAKVPYLGTSSDFGAGAARVLKSSPHHGDRSEWIPHSAAGIALPCLDEKALERLVEFHHSGKAQGHRFGDVAPSRVVYREKRDRGSVCAVFRFENADGKMHAYDCRETCAVAEKVRRALFDAATRTKKMSIEFLHGHHAAGREHIHILPLPSIGHEHADGRLRRVLLYGSPAAGESHAVDLVLKELAWASGWDPKRPEIVLAPERTAVGVARVYLRSRQSGECEWSTVTPIVLPNPELRGREGALWRSRHSADARAQARLRRKIEERRHKIVARLLQAAGLQPIELQISLHPASRQLPEAARFEVPQGRAKYLNHTRCHVRARFAQPVGGPLVIGLGRFFGLGLFAPTRALKCASQTTETLATLPRE